MKFLKWILKLLGSAIFVFITIIIVLYAIQFFGVKTINFDFLNNIPFWDRVTNVQKLHNLSFNLILFGIAGVCICLSMSLVLSLIPVFGKIILKIINLAIGGFIMFVSILLIVIGSLGVSEVIPGI